MRHSSATLLLSLWILLLPAAARADLGIDTLVVTVTTEGKSGIDTVFQVTLSVTGTEIASASITPQGGTAIPLSCSTATSCSVTQSLANQAALDALLPTSAKNFTLTLTGTAVPPASAPTVTDTISFARPLVPSPAISAPVDASTIEPGALTVQFLACASCSASTHAVLLKDGVSVEESDLPASSASWKPALALAAESEYGAKITHATGGVQNLTADGIGAGTEDDAYTFTHGVTHADQVAFSTGFAPPVGDFCMVVNDDPSDAIDAIGCALVEEPAAGILDTSDTCTANAAGIPIQYDLQLAANGALSGIADADLDGNASLETHAMLAGRLRGGNGLLRQRLRVRFDAGSDTRLAFRIREQADLATLGGTIVPPLEWLVEQTLRGKTAGVRQDESTTTLRTLPALPSDGIQCAGGTARTGWKLSFSLTGAEGPSAGSLELANGDSVALVVRQRFDIVTNLSRLRLESRGAEPGVRIQVKRLEIDDTSDQLIAGVVRFRAFGQGGSVLLP